MAIFSLFLDNISSPPILFFFLGLIAGFVKSDLEIPQSISRYLSLYLLMSIGLKGGGALCDSSFLSKSSFLTFLSGLGIGFIQPFIGYALLKKFTILDRATAAAVAAHYGSVSVVTFVAATSFLQQNCIVYAGYIVGVLALMEIPAILSGLFLAKKRSSQNLEKPSLHLREIFTNGSLVLLIGSFLIGLLTGKTGLEKVESFFITPFQGVLAFFLLDMGLAIAKYKEDLKKFTLGLALFGIYMPLIGGFVGVCFSKVLGLSLGTGVLFTVLCASASYIAVPAAMKVALPQAKSAIYLPMALAITFPFNISIGIPLYFALCKYAIL